MELKKLNATAQVELETETGKLIFTVSHIREDQAVLDYQGAGKLSDRIRAALTDAIVGWNLTHDDGTAWECTPETRAVLMPQLVVFKLKQKLDSSGKVLIPEGMLLGLALAGFVYDEENFLKN